MDCAFLKTKPCVPAACQKVKKAFVLTERFPRPAEKNYSVAQKKS